MADDPTRLEALQRYYEKWPFFRTVMSNMAQVLAKSDMGLAHRYAQLVPDEELREKVFGMIVDEHERTIGMCAKITGIDDLLHDNAALKRSVYNRFPYLEPLNLLQVELLRRFRAGGGHPPVGASRHPADHERSRDGPAQQRLASRSCPQP